MMPTPKKNCSSANNNEKLSIARHFFSGMLFFASCLLLLSNFDYQGNFCFHAYIWLMLLPASFIPVVEKQKEYRKAPLVCLGLFVIHSLFVPSSLYFTMLFLANLAHMIINLVVFNPYY